MVADQEAAAGMLSADPLHEGNPQSVKPSAWAGEQVATHQPVWTFHTAVISPSQLSRHQRPSVLSTWLGLIEHFQVSR